MSPVQVRQRCCTLEAETNNMCNSVDVDDCDTLNGGCDHNCLNLEGSFECSCRDGFALGEDSMSCEDIDECLADECSHTCVNLAGGFRCECPEGYYLGEDRLMCIGGCGLMVIGELPNYIAIGIQILMNVSPLMAAVLTTASTLMEVMSVPVEMGSYWERTAHLVKMRMNALLTSAATHASTCLEGSAANAPRGTTWATTGLRA